MIKGADRKEDTKAIQFRAASRYSNMIELIADAINEKFKMIGCSDKFTTTDVMKLAVESLCFGKSETEMLGRKIEIRELVLSHLKIFYKEFDIEKYRRILDKLFTREVLLKIKQIEEVMFETMLDNKKGEDDNFTNERWILEAETSLLKCSGWYTDKKRELATRKLEHVNYYLDIVKNSHCGVKIGFEEAEYEKMKVKIEEEILSISDFKYLYALKLFDNYRFSEILASLRNQIDIRIEYFREYLKDEVINDPFAPKESDYMHDDCDEEDDYYDNYSGKSSDDNYEFSAEEGYDNWFGK